MAGRDERLSFFAVLEMNIICNNRIADKRLADISVRHPFK